MATFDHSEEWRVVAMAPKYSVSSLGRVRSDSTGRVLSQRFSPNGYLRVGLYAGGRKLTVNVHRLVALAFLGDAEGREVNHRDGVKCNNVLSNLEWATAADNIRHVYRTGLKGRAKAPREKKAACVLRDLTGRTFGRWAVVARAGALKSTGGAIWLCRCECGAERPVTARSLVNGRSQSCGCRHKEIVAAIGQRTATHRMSGTPEYHAWCAMIQRCTNPKVRNYADYGGRGITVCPEWQASFEAFYDHVGPRPSEGHSLDRIDNERGYFPGNVRWTTDEVQRDNSRHPRKFLFEGTMLSIAAIARRVGIKAGTLQFRLIQMGWAVERATTQDPKQYHGRARPHEA